MSLEPDVENLCLCILRHLESRRISNPMVITGDWHSTFVNDLLLNFNKPESKVVATEFVGTSISTNGDQSVDMPDGAAAKVERPGAMACVRKRKYQVR